MIQLKLWKLSFLIGCSLILSLAGCGNLVETSYPDMEAVLQAGALEQGWLPAFLPQSATNIREAHDLETRQIWAAFELPFETIEKLGEVCTQISVEQIQPPQSAPRWWNERALTDPWNAFYVCQDASAKGYLAVVGSSEQAYYWSYR